MPLVMGGMATVHKQRLSCKYSLVRLVVPNTEELISLPFMGLLKIRWLLQDRMRTWDPHFWVAVLNRSLLFCPSHMHTLLPLLSGHCSRICSGTGLMYLSPNKYMRPASEQILLECPLMNGSCVCVRGKTKWLAEHCHPKMGVLGSHAVLEQPADLQ